MTAMTAPSPNDITETGKSMYTAATMEAGHSSQDGNTIGHSRSDTAGHNQRGGVRYAGSEREGCCGLSLDELSHEGLGQKQELRSQDDQNKFVAALIRKGLYCDGWKLVITGMCM